MRVSIASAGQAELDDLFTWLSHDTELDAEVSVGAVNDDELGGLEIIDVVLTQVVAISSLAVAVASFLQSRHRPERLVLTKANGDKLAIENPTDDTAKAIEDFLADGPEPTDQP